jgi:hypothetical protein
MSATVIQKNSPFGVPWPSAIGFAVVVTLFVALSLATFDPQVKTVTWVIRIVGTAGWVVFAIILGYRDIVAKKGDGPQDIDKVAFDRWSWVHATAGCMFGLWGVPLLLVAVITVAWEFFEKYVPGFGENEIIWNRVVDVLGAWLGWTLVALLIAVIESDSVPFFWPLADAWIRNL